jgi:hypothetical protein
MKKALFAVLILSSALFLLSQSCYGPGPYGPTGNVPQRQLGPTGTPTATFQPTPALVGAWPVTEANAMAADSTYVYVAEGGTAVTQVQLFNSPNGGQPAVASWTGYGTSTPFLFPAGVAVNSAATSVYVLDQGVCSDSECDSTNGSAVYVFSGTSSSPTTLGTWTTYGSLPFNAPSGIAVDSSGNVYVADMDNAQVEEFSSSGVTQGAWNADFMPAAITLDSGNNIYVVDAFNYLVWKNTAINGTATHWPLAYVGNEDYPDYGVGVDGNGNVLVADYVNQWVEVYTNSGELIGAFTGSNGTQFTGPDALMIYGNNIYVADYDNSNIQIFGPDNY